VKCKDHISHVPPTPNKHVVISSNLKLAAHSLTLSPSHQAHLLLKTQTNHHHNHSQAGKKKKPRYLTIMAEDGDLLAVPAAAAAAAAAAAGSSFTETAGRSAAAGEAKLIICVDFVIFTDGMSRLHHYPWLTTTAAAAGSCVHLIMINCIKSIFILYFIMHSCSHHNHNIISSHTYYTSNRLPSPSQCTSLAAQSSSSLHLLLLKLLHTRASVPMALNSRQQLTSLWKEHGKLLLLLQILQHSVQLRIGAPRMLLT